MSLEIDLLRAERDELKRERDALRQELVDVQVILRAIRDAAELHLRLADKMRRRQ
jgi:hypothetical protein